MMYFGTAIDQAGHYWWSPGMRWVCVADRVEAPAVFRRREPCPLGEKDWQWSISHTATNTIVMCWGSIFDKRPNSITCFLLDGVHGLGDAGELIQAAFPEIWNALTKKP